MDSDVQILKQIKLFDSLTIEELKNCLKKMKQMKFNQDDYLIHQADNDKALYIITEGSVAVLKTKAESSQEHQIITLKAGEIFGELSLIDKNPRSSSVKALEPTEVLCLSQEDLNALYENPELYKKLSHNFLNNLSQRLRYTNEVTVTSLEKQLELTKTQIVAGNFMVVLIVMLTMFSFLLGSMKYLTQILGTASLITTSAVLILLLVFLIGAKRTGYPWSFFGFTTKNLKKSVVESILFTAPIIAIITLAKFLLISFVPKFSGIELFNFGKGAVSISGTSSTTIILMAVAYIFISSPIQEVLFRGGLQSLLQFFLIGKHRYLLANIATNLIFAMVHLILSFVLAILVFIMGSFWSYLYQRQKTLIGVILSHVMVGTWIFFILGIQSILTKLQ